MNSRINQQVLKPSTDQTIDLEDTLNLKVALRDTSKEGPRVLQNCWLAEPDEVDDQCEVSATYYRQKDLRAAHQKLSLLKSKLSSSSIPRKINQLPLVPVSTAPNPRDTTIAVQSVNIQNSFNLNNLKVISQPKLIRVETDTQQQNNS
jgi:hypothetical protein